MKKSIKNTSEKFCPKCKTTKKSDEFYVLGWCKVCHSVYTKDWRKNNPTYYKKWYTEHGRKRPSGKPTLLAKKP